MRSNGRLISMVQTNDTIQKNGEATGETAARTTRGNSRKRASSRAERSDGPLTADDWIEAAMDILAEDNVAGVQTSALCQKLHVTKGSFYWHFKALGDLLNGVLDSWRRRTTLNVINRFTKPGDDAATLRTLLSLPRHQRAAKSAAVELSIRDWARRDATAKRAIEEVDQIRLSFYEQLFHRQGFTGEAAKVRAYIAYAAMMGDSILQTSLKDQVSSDTYLNALVALLSTSGEQQ
jgi:AcrR family transcriptional regulator